MNTTKLDALRQKIRYAFGKADHRNLVPDPDYSVGHGFIRLTVDGYRFNVYGGSYLNRPANIAGVKLAPEIWGLTHPYDLSLDIPDYSAPSLEEFCILLDDIITLGKERSEVYIGCMGGYGRTGVVVSGLIMVVQGMTAVDAVSYTRQYINRHCVEVTAQHLLLVALEMVLEDNTITDLANSFRS